MNVFEQELKKIIGQSNALIDPKYVGRACYGRVSSNIRAKLQFVTRIEADKYVALEITLINNTEGVIDKNMIFFKDIWGVNSIDSRTAPNQIYPYIRAYPGEMNWQGYDPTPADFEILANSMDEHLEIFSEDIEQNSGQTMI